MDAAIAAGKHIYCEKPVTPDVATALALARAARDAGVKVGVVQDKLFLPGLLKLRRLVESGFFGRIIAARGEFGYWVYPGPDPKPQRPSWNYRTRGRRRDHQRHVPPLALRARQRLRAGALGDAPSARTHIPTRIDEAGEAYEATAEDAAYAMFEFDGGLIVQMNSSWCVRVNRDELFELQVDGTHGSAVAGLRECKVQPADRDAEVDLEPGPARSRRAPRRRGSRCRPPSRPRTASSCSGRRSCATSCSTSRSRGTSSRRAKGVQLYELGEQSWKERRWVDVPELTL